jgi:glutamine amidotransferase
MSSVAVIDYGMGNLRSVSKALEHMAPAGTRVRVTHVEQEILSADRVVFPGVGAARDCMEEIRSRGLEDVVREAAAGKPFLGICMGMQVLLEHSEENGGTPCLGVLPGAVRYFGERLSDPRSGERLKIPHMGWNQVRQTRPHPLWNGIAQDTRFYFVHSYYVDPADAALSAASTDYGLRFTAAVARDNLFAVQFHPEKSQQAGLQLLANFLAWDGTD